MTGLAAPREGGSRLLWGPDGRPRVPWRLGAFLGVFLLLFLVLGLVALWAGGAPTVQHPLTWQSTLPLALAAFAASVWAMERLERTPVAALGLAVGPGQLGWLGRGFLVGAGIMGLALAVLAAGGWLSWRSGPGGALEGVADAVGLTPILFPAAWAEELLFRGYPLQLVAARVGATAAIVGTSIGFAALHLLNPGVDALAVLNLALAGLVLGVAWWRTYSLWFATGLHLGWNWLMLAVDLPVSGLAFDLPGFDAVLAGPELWTGGEFGPEGGFAVTCAALAGLAWLARTRRLTRDLATLALRPLHERRSPELRDDRLENRAARRAPAT